ncbi:MULTISPECIES: hypothetical protein [Exiguobacterium]|uniref:hypothetical protein n=1 Tax=Exiguobacterium TaxID=33986 RepID=UPI001BECDBDF|nr:MULTISPECIES: hypothetical protein [Exiguobacterium]MCT4791050.1 hypothetical protein [Exiguobacterium artemiae]
MDAVKRLKEDIENSADWNVTITVSKKDLEKLIRAYEELKKQSKQEDKTKK